MSHSCKKQAKCKCDNCIGIHYCKGFIEHRSVYRRYKKKQVGNHEPHQETCLQSTK